MGLARNAACMMEGNFKARVGENFSRSASTYDCHAEEQCAGAATLAKCAAECAENLVEGPVLEIGCGTGFLSASLAEIFPERRLELTDLAPAMIAHCRQKMATEVSHPDLHYRVLDGEQLASEGCYALICASFVIHWFADLCAGLQQLLTALKPGGRLLCSYPGAGSYAEWHRQCARQGTPCSANALPDLAAVARAFAAEPVALRQWKQVVALRFPTARAFLCHLKSTGAHTSARLSTLGPAQLRQLLRGWDRDCPNGVEITCVIHYLSIEKAGGGGG